MIPVEGYGASFALSAAGRGCWRSSAPLRLLKCIEGPSEADLTAYVDG
jgi:hypothetical protein